MIEVDQVGDTGWVVKAVSYVDRPPRSTREVFVCVKHVIAHVTNLLNYEAKDMAVHCFEGTHACPECSKLADPPTETPDD